MRDLKVIRKGKPKQTSKMPKWMVALIVVSAMLVVVAVCTVCIYFLAENEVFTPVQSEPCYIENAKTSTLILNTGDKQVLTVAADDEISRTLEFSSSDKDVLTVDSGGRVDAIKEGTATVTAKGAEYTGKCVITVNKSEPKPKVKEYTTAYTANEDVLAKNKANKKKNPYSITVNRRTNTVTVYTYDDNGDYVLPVRAMVCSCGIKDADNITIKGAFSVYFKEKWHPLYGNVYGQYVTGFSGSYLFHSVPYLKASSNTLKTAEFNKLSTHASQGCVRLMVSDAKWIYDNISIKTVVEVVDQPESYDVLGRPPVVKIPHKLKWDPTDPHKYNPYNKKAPVISGAKDVTVKVGGKYEPEVTAVDTCSQDITDRIETVGNVLTNKKGMYLVTYSVTDDLSKTTELTVKVTVK